MPKVVDHEVRRRELAEALWRVTVRDGVADVSIRSVAAEAGWSSGALRHYFSTRAELLAFACQQVIDEVTSRVSTMRRTGSARQAVSDTLLQTMPADTTRHTEASIAFAFLALGLSDPELARVQRLHFSSMYELCLQLLRHLDAENALTQGHVTLENLAHRLHALVDGLSVHVLAGHLTAGDMIAQLNAYLDELTAEPESGSPATSGSNQGTRLGNSRGQGMGSQGHLRSAPGSRHRRR
ncbi:TetR family transcriptional regulator C-terminal domain-containing protein [Rugosimonospora acidiphila]|uniref:TetR family transcriptional regulator C-terminal domain-containing protein n=1 Tax=Rugosimonospora acidiphila TaxID=556531 RepID=A0ABP9RKK5_9ACTN